MNATAASLLGFLHERPMSGWDLVATAQALIGDFWTLTRSQVYRELAAMESAGLVVAGPAGPRDRRPYELTDAGRSAFVEWLQRPPGPEQIRYPLLLTIAFGRHLPPGRLATMLDAYEAAHAERLTGYERLDATLAAEGADPFVRATLSFGLHYERAVLAWLADLPTTVRGGTAEGVDG